MCLGPLNAVLRRQRRTFGFHQRNGMHPVFQGQIGQVVAEYRVQECRRLMLITRTLGEIRKATGPEPSVACTVRVGVALMSYRKTARSHTTRNRNVKGTSPSSHAPSACTPRGYLRIRTQRARGQNHR